MAKRTPKFLKPMQKRSIWEWVIKNKKFLMGNAPLDTDVAVMCSKALGFTVTRSHIHTARKTDELVDDDGQLITWEPKKKPSVAKSMGKIRTVANELVGTQQDIAAIAQYLVETDNAIPQAIKQIALDTETHPHLLDAAKMTEAKDYE